MSVRNFKPGKREEQSTTDNNGQCKQLWQSEQKETSEENLVLKSVAKQFFCCSIEAVLVKNSESPLGRRKEDVLVKNVSIAFIKLYYQSL